MIRNFDFLFAMIIGTSLLVPIFCNAINQTVSVQDDGLMQLMKEKCDNVSSDGSAYAAVEQAVNDLRFCVEKVIDKKQIKLEIKTARLNGEWSPIISKYCSNHTAIFDCVAKFEETFEVCLEPKEIDDSKILLNAIKNQLNFVCHRDGDRLNLFLATKGPDCIIEQADNLIKCFEPLIVRYESEVQSHLDASITVQDCDDLKSANNCINQHLENCEKSTPADLIELMFHHFVEDLGCSSLTSVNVSADSSTSEGPL